MWALFAIAIPIIIHLFNFRKFQKIYFSNIDLLKEVKLETQSKSKLKHLIILMIRILAIAVLVLAFCQPYIPTNQAEMKGDSIISVYIDNSHSMDSKGTNGYRLDLAKEQAEKIISNYGPTDLFQIITNDFEGRHQRLYNKSEAIQLIDEIEPSFQSRMISEVLLRQKDILANEEANKTVYLLSDFQKKSSNFDAVKKDSSIQIICLPYYNEGSENVYIDSIWFETPLRRSESEDVLFAKVVNAYDYPIEFKLNLTINGENRAFINFSADAKTSLNCKIPFTIKGDGIMHGELTVEDYPDATVTFDDNFYFSYFINKGINVLHLHNGTYETDSSGYFGVLFGKNDYFNFKNQSLKSFDFSTLGSYDFVLLSEISNISSGMQSELVNFVNNGGNVCVFPNDEIDLNSYNLLLQSISSITLSPKVNSINKVSALLTEHPIYQDIFDEIPSNIDLPIVNNYYPINASATSGSEKLMTLQNGNPYMVYSKNQKGSLTVCASSLNLNSSNFAKHALFVPTLLRLAEFSQYRGDYYHIVGKDNTIATKQTINTSDKVEITNANESFSFLPEVKNNKNETNLILYNQIKSAGHYNLLVNGEAIQGFSFNYNRDESSQDFYNESELKNAIGNSEIGVSTEIFENADSLNGIDVLDIVKGKKYWWHLIIFALVLLGLEIIIFRLWK